MKSNAEPYSPRFEFVRMDTLATIVLTQPSFDIVRDTEVPMLVIERFKDVDKVHATILWNFLSRIHDQESHGMMENDFLA